MYASMTKVNRGISIDTMSTRRSMDINGRHGSNCLHRCGTCVLRGLWRLSSIRLVRVCPIGSSLPDETNDQGLGGHAYLDQCFVEYDWQLSTSDYRFILKPQVTYTMTNADGTLFGSGTFYITEDTTTSLTMNSLTTACFDELNARYAEIRDIPSSHQEAIAWTVNDNDYTMSWTAKDYAPTW